MKLKLQSDIRATHAIWDVVVGQDQQWKYRYVLYREWNSSLPKMVFIGCNPSVADENYDDRTVRRCIGFAKRENHGSISMLNAFAFISTDPKGLNKCDDPIGKANDYYTLTECENADLIIVAWGRNANINNRHTELLKILCGKKLYCFGVNSDGTPKHPLYLSHNTKLQEYRT